VNPAFRSMVVPTVIAIALTASSSAHAQWPADGLFINALPATTNATTDGAGGIFMSWPAAFGTTIQRISPTGELVLGTDGVNISLIITSPTACFSDGAGGVYVAGHFNSYLRLLRLDAQGNILWNKDVSQTLGAKYNLRGCPDGAGGALLAWSENRDLPVPENAASPYCQRVDADGNAMWTSNGARVWYQSWYPPHSTSPVGLTVDVLDVFPAANGGAFVMTTYWNYYGDTDPMVVHYMPPTGTSADGVLSTPNYGLKIFPNGAGGVYATYYDGADLRLTLYTPGAGLQFDVALSSFAVPSVLNHQPVMALTSGGVLVAWGRDYDVYAQKVSNDGTQLWTPGGIPVCPVGGNQDDIVIGQDFHGGAHVFWSDARYGKRDIYHQHIDSNGATLLGLDYGEQFTSRDGDAIRTALYMDPAGYGIVTWNSAQANYALRFDNSALAVAISSFHAEARRGIVELRARYLSDIDVKSVNVYRGADNEQLKLIATVDGPANDRLRFPDNSVRPNTTYRYQIGVVDDDGEFLSQIETVTTPRIQIALEQNVPNPFNPETTIRFVLPQPDRAIVAIYTLAGERVRTLLDAPAPAGSGSVTWDGTDDHGSRVSSGVYLYKLQAGKLGETRKMILLK